MINSEMVDKISENRPETDKVSFTWNCKFVSNLNTDGNFGQ